MYQPGLWARGQKAHVDIMVTNLLAKIHCNKECKTVEGRRYNRRVLEVENATFTQLVISCFGAKVSNVTCFSRS